jgi:hypothetical protein
VLHPDVDGALPRPRFQQIPSLHVSGTPDHLTTLVQRQAVSPKQHGLGPHGLQRAFKRRQLSARTIHAMPQGGRGLGGEHTLPRSSDDCADPYGAAVLQHRHMAASAGQLCFGLAGTQAFIQGHDSQPATPNRSLHC